VCVRACGGAPHFAALLSCQVFLNSSYALQVAIINICCGVFTLGLSLNVKPFWYGALQQQTTLLSYSVCVCVRRAPAANRFRSTLDAGALWMYCCGLFSVVRGGGGACLSRVWSRVTFAALGDSEKLPLTRLDSHGCVVAATVGHQRACCTGVCANRACAFCTHAHRASCCGVDRTIRGHECLAGRARPAVLAGTGRAGLRARVVCVAARTCVSCII
jgi:hypothetical protein